MFILGGDTVVGEGGMDANVIYLSVFYCLFFIRQNSVGMLEEHFMVERDPKLEI